MVFEAPKIDSADRTPVIALLEEFIQSRDSDQPPGIHTFLRLLPDQESRESLVRR